jgi:predicted AAA+ superfamily ATPase
VHTSLRGRGWETVIRPFSFREYLRHRGAEPVAPPQRWTPAVRERELRSLQAARAVHPRARALLLVLHREQLFNAGDGIEARAAYDWLLEKDEQV